ncbi:MAG: BatA domain-containing protein [Planctomycetaceae bacterium]|nr:BatA domain-containing protein [Planctomycetaceae bacterium]
MIFTTFSFFLGALAASAIPVLLHLLMRGKPKRIEFPALMFIRKRL